MMRQRCKAVLHEALYFLYMFHHYSSGLQTWAISPLLYCTCCMSWGVPSMMSHKHYTQIQLQPEMCQKAGPEAVKRSMFLMYRAKMKKISTDPTRAACTFNVKKISYMSPSLQVSIVHTLLQHINSLRYIMYSPSVHTLCIMSHLCSSNTIV